MWRTSFNLLRHSATTAARCGAAAPRKSKWLNLHLDGKISNSGHGCFFGRNLGGAQYCSGSTVVGGGDDGKGEGNEQIISVAEAKKLMRLVSVEALKGNLGLEQKEVIAYSQLLDACQIVGVAKSREEAEAFSRVLDEAGVILLFRDKVYLHPDKVVDLVRKAMPIALLPEGDPSTDELNKLQEVMDGIDKLAHRQVRFILWTGLGAGILLVGLFFRLTFWEFSWDVMEPIAFFTTTTGLVIGYAYFLFTSRDPTYQDMLKRLFISRRRKLIKKKNFDIQRFVELQKKCRLPQNGTNSMNRKLGVDLEEMLHGH
ncbi:unnamed protein product [Cuscuta epithymum]|uniref:Calcium uniporter protein C-terminal domain-containing protein n=1 Tax=Cuscuta epithymum TaxID=186058 RepID=A0AAV0CGP1_9ASTE|nr:unnamed protein product [Cuscuta epithymum]